MIKLTKREKEVLQLMTKNSARETAEHLKVTIDAVEFHLLNIYRKYGVNKIQTAVLVGLRNGEIINDT